MGRKEKGTVVPMNAACPFEELDKAYKAGIRARKAGKPVSANPYPQHDKRKCRSSSFDPYGRWISGWIAGGVEMGTSDDKPRRSRKPVAPQAAALVGSVRELEKDHAPEGWPAIISVWQKGAVLQPLFMPCDAFVLQIIQDILDGTDLLQFVVGDRDAEGLFHLHDQLDEVEGIGPQIVDEQRLGNALLPGDIQLLHDDADYLFFKCHENSLLSKWTPARAGI